jgi:integrase
MTTTAVNTRKARGIHPKRVGLQQRPREKGSNLPEYLERQEIEAVIAAAPNPLAKLLMLEQWRAGLRVSEALALEKRDLFLDSDRPTLRVRRGKGNKARVVPLHPELQTALIAATSYGGVGQGRLIDVSRTTAWRWVQAAARLAIERGQLASGRNVGTHTLRHSYARHLLMHGIPINHLSRRLGHASITPTLVYLELVPDPAGSLALVP